MRKPKNLAIFAAALVLIGVLNFSIWKKENILRSGKTVILELAPVDPRSLMQGDYMILNFTLSRDISAALRSQELDMPAKASLIVNLDQNQIAKLANLEIDKAAQLQPHQMRLQYRYQKGQAHLGTNAFFFQEGTAEIYAQAKYGEFKVSQQGEMLLVRMLDASLQPLGVNRWLN